MTTISLKLPAGLLERLERESRARRTTKSSLVRECLEQQLPAKPRPLDLPELPPGESFYDQALPILKQAWARNRRLPRDLASNPKYMKGFPVLVPDDQTPGSHLAETPLPYRVRRRPAKGAGKPPG